MCLEIYEILSWLLSSAHNRSELDSSVSRVKRILKAVSYTHLTLPTKRIV